MSRILLGWELGAGFGHLAILTPTGQELCRQGHQVVLAARDVGAARSYCAGTGIEIREAPYWPMPQRGRDPATTSETLAEPFYAIGYHEPDALAARTAEWDRLIDEVRPDLVVVEFAPTLALAAFGRIPTVTVGTGYTIPPEGARLPSIRSWVPEISQAAAEQEDRITDALTAVQKGRGAPVPDFFADVLAAGTPFVCTVPMLDPYRERRSSPAIGPINAVAAGPRADAPAGGFAYLAGDAANLDLILHGLSCSGVAVDVYTRGTPAGWAAKHARPGLRLLEERQNLVERLPQVAVLVHHGGSATTHEALWAGVPQILLSKTLEQSLTGRAISEAGVGGSLSPRDAAVAERLVQALWRVTREPRFAETADRLGAELRRDYPSGSHHVILAHVAGVLAGTEGRPS